MINGINVLNKTEILTTEPIYIIWLLLLISAIILLVSFVITIICMSCDNNFLKNIGTISGTTLIVSFFSSLILLLLMSATGKTVHTGKYAYEVIIDDEVSLNEFYEKYEIIDVNGKIYTIKER